MLPAAGAHPLGNFTVNQYTRIEVGVHGVGLSYVLDLAEIPTFQEQSRVDADGNGQVSDAESVTERDRLVGEILPRLALTVGGRPAALVVDSAGLRYLDGQGGLQTTRLELRLRADDVELGTTPVSIDLRNDYASDRVGWREIVVAREAGTAVLSTTAATADRTNGLRSYPQDLLQSPPDQTAATVEARRGSGGIAVEGVRTQGNVAAGEAGRGDDRFASLIDGDRRGTMGVAIALGLAMVFGGRTPMTPGHGKAMVAAYLAGTRGTARHAFALGATVIDHAHRGRLRARPGHALAVAVHPARDALPLAQPRERRDGGWPSGSTPSAIGSGAGSAAACSPPTWSTATGTRTAATATPTMAATATPPTLATATRTTTATPRTAATATATPTAGTGTRTRHPTTCAGAR